MLQAEDPFILYEGTIVDTPAIDKLRIRRNRTLAVDATGTIVADMAAAEVQQLDSDMSDISHLTASIVSARDNGRHVCLLPGQMLLPGFVDCHVHAPQFSYTGTGLDRPLMGPDGWLEQYTFPAELSLQDDLDAARERYLSVVTRTLRHGTTTAMYFASLHLEPTKILASIADTLGQRALVGKVCMDRHCPPSYCASCDDNVKETEAFIKYVQAHCSTRVSAVVTPRFVPTCSPGLLTCLGNLAKQYQCRIQTHVAESHDEVAFCRELHADCPRDMSMLAKCGLLDGPVISVLAHAVHLSDDEFQQLGRDTASIAHCPLSNAYFADACFRLLDALSFGLKVGLGTDVAGGYDPAMLSAIRAAIWTSRLVQKGVSSYDFGDGPIARKAANSSNASIDHVGALWLATQGGAEALDLQNQIGTLSVGKAFDALLIDTQSYDSPIDVYIEDDEADLLQKFLHVGDDRNICEVFVQGQSVSRREPKQRRAIIGGSTCDDKEKFRRRKSQLSPDDKLNQNETSNGTRHRFHT